MERTEPNAAVTVESKVYSLGRIPDSEAEQAFHDFVAASADSARKDVLGDARADVGFNYTLTPRGPVYPFSEIEVACVVKAKNVRRYGRSLCSGMFDLIDSRFAPLKK